MRALTRLNQAGQAVQNETKGRPPEMELRKIMRDPNNPRPPLDQRTPAEQQKQRELNANIKKRGVKSPISLRPHPTIPDMWIINYGHCRYDGAEAAGHATIPYFVDLNFNSYDQITENTHRGDLSPWSIAQFIKRKLDEGESKGQVADGLSQENQDYVTNHLALVDAPSCLHQAYANGVRSPRTLYDLRRAYEEFPDQIEQWVESGGKITRDTIKEVVEKLRHDVKTNDAGHSAGAPAAVVDQLQDQVPALADQADALAAVDQVPALADQADAQAAVDQVPALADRAGALAAVDQMPALADQAGALNTGESIEKAIASNAGAGGGLRHDVKKRPDPAALKTQPTVSKSSVGKGIQVQYKGKAARIVPNTTVKIVMDGHNDPLEVPLAELAFEGR